MCPTKYIIHVRNFSPTPQNYKGSKFDFLPFGARKRMCPGILFATPTIELPLAQLLYYFDWKLPSGISHENFDMKSELFVIPIAYNPLVRVEFH